LPMSMKEDIKTAADEAWNNGEHADEAGANGDFIMIEADTRVDRCYFPFSIFVRICHM
jgi:hypothetical protein